MRTLTTVEITSQCVLKPATSLNASRHHCPDPLSELPCSRVIGRGPSSRSSLFATEPWRRFTHPEGLSYFVLNSEPSLCVITVSNIHDTETSGRILDCLKFVKRELQDQSIRLPSQCELFLESGQDQISYNYYLVDHTEKSLFWLQDVDIDQLGIRAANVSLHHEMGLERLYWMHVELYPMHHKFDEQSQLEDDLYKIIARGQAAGLMSRTSAFSYNPDTCKQFLKLLSRKKGQHMDGRTLCYAARLAGAITNQELVEFSGQQSTHLDRLQGICLSDVAKGLSDLACLLQEHNRPYPHLCPAESVHMNEMYCRSRSIPFGPSNASALRTACCRDLFAYLDSNGVEGDHTSVNLSEMMKTGMAEAQVSMDDIRFNFPHDLTGYVTRSDIFPSASGAFGYIYRGRLTIRGRPTSNVAIKVHRLCLQHDEHLPKRMNRYRREIIVNLQLNHPNVLPLFGIVRDPSMHPDIPAMVCPWIENGALSTYLERNKNLTVAQRFVLVDGVAHGLRYLHSRQIVHGDLSGSNVLVHGDGSACIGDFGLSTLLTAIGGPTFATSRSNKGTVRWMAPELLLPDTAMNPTTQSDIYSFGSIMLQILTGDTPYHHLPRDGQVILAISRGTKPDRSNQETVTNDRWNFIKKCWSVDPNGRPLSEEVVEFVSQERSGCEAHMA